MIIHNLFFDTYPFMFHSHGRAKWSNHRFGLPLKKQFFDETSGGKTATTFLGRKEYVTYPALPIGKKMNDINSRLTVFMLCNLTELGSAARCLDFYGIQYTVVGKKAPTIDGNTKIREIINFIPNVKTKYVMLVDSDDIFIVKDGFTELVETYQKEYDCKILFQAEGWNFPKGNPEMDEFERSVVDEKTPYKHLNSGIWIAETEFLKSIYDDLVSIKPHVPGDQPTFKLLYKKHYPKIKIDSRCRFFQSLAWSSWFEQTYPEVMKLEVL